jgi:carbonic anhydrase/acetyltransferase-like protein (isoleucine patch superfamily)
MRYMLGERRLQLVGEGHFVADSASIVGSVTLHHQASVWFGAVIRGDNETIVIGESTNIQDGAVLHTDEGVEFSLGQYVTIGIQAVVLNRVVIGRNCLIGSQALITEGKVIPDGSVVMGSPGKIVRQVTADEIVWMKANALHYAQNARRYLCDLRAGDQ